MTKKINIFFLLILVVKTINTNAQITSNSSELNKNKIEKHYSICQSSEERCKCVVEYELKDSIELIHIKKQFYRSNSGHLYEKTDGTKDGKNYFIYFAGCISQEIDPTSFVELDGWYAKDKRNVYYFRPVSGGMQISKLEKADTKTFKILKGEYKYGIDKNHLFNETDIIENINVNKIKFLKDKKGKIIKIKSGKELY